MSEIFLILGLSPLTQYNLVSIAINALIIVLAYLFLRICQVPDIPSGISSLSILYITSGANLPGIWNLIPLSLGILLYLCGLCFWEIDDLKSSIASFIAVALFYPPLAIFPGLGLSAILLQEISKNRDSWAKKIKVISSYLLVLLLAILVVCFILSKFALWGFVSQKLLYRLYTFYIPQFNFYDIMPIPVVLAALLGLSPVFKKRKYLFFQLALGVFFWILYSFTDYRFAIELEKVMFLTAIVVALFSGFGLQELANYIKSKGASDNIFRYAGIGIIALLLIFVPFYTQRENWQNLLGVVPSTGDYIYPKSPANNYLTEDDMRIFGDIKEKRFLTIPWKGTVIGIATGNYPSIAKEGTMSAGLETHYYSFINSGCDVKKSIIDGYKPDYVYLPEFNCPGFEKIDESQEGLILYKVNRI